MMDTDHLFHQMMSKVPKEKQLCRTWEELPQGKKRWCLYHWIGTNMFGLRERVPLPSCIVEYVREKVPNDGDLGFVGYQPKYSHNSIMSPKQADAGIEEGIPEEGIPDDNEFDQEEPTTADFAAYAKVMEEEEKMRRAFEPAGEKKVATEKKVEKKEGSSI
ncbi:hypothetical protein SEMRO_2543_G330740.1 [Seminavis robusta]|uniref:Uncharacterized protein n=1 Tax=Seminavis robusta TaxID=568900 RepID=A0A9N8F2P2_9STRA|nr:hypothetical protein SEMRO_2543_G330740.1 [Seminavis robusta]|eukprot:Sro2543_g330740.1 n/a (161) ;mRNA; f:791-1273